MPTHPIAPDPRQLAGEAGLQLALRTLAVLARVSWRRNLQPGPARGDVDLHSRTSAVGAVRVLCTHLAAEVGQAAEPRGSGGPRGLVSQAWAAQGEGHQPRGCQGLLSARHSTRADSMFTESPASALSYKRGNGASERPSELSCPWAGSGKARAAGCGSSLASMAQPHGEEVLLPRENLGD